MIMKRSSADADRLAGALEAAIGRFDGESPVTGQVHDHIARRLEPAPLRMQLVVAAAEAEGGSAEGALDAACAVEILHHHALVHADVAAGERADSLPARFGLAHGINAGDALCALGYLQLGLGATRPPELAVAMTRALHEAEYEMCGARAAGSDPVPLLLGAACQLGAFAAGADPARAAAYARLGRTYGVDAAPGIDPQRRVRGLLDAARR